MHGHLLDGDLLARDGRYHELHRGALGRIRVPRPAADGQYESFNSRTREGERERGGGGGGERERERERERALTLVREPDPRYARIIGGLQPPLAMPSIPSENRERGRGGREGGRGREENSTTPEQDVHW